jgi:hypothetical protein
MELGKEKNLKKHAKQLEKTINYLYEDSFSKRFFLQ